MDPFRIVVAQKPVGVAFDLAQACPHDRGKRFACGEIAFDIGVFRAERLCGVARDEARATRSLAGGLE
jgi:hypothetical protein